jgi:putative aldouronate transport system substrate-binding protein
LVTGAIAVTACSPAAQQTAAPEQPAEATTAPKATQPQQEEPTKAPEAEAPAAPAAGIPYGKLDWDFYPRTDPRHWVVYEPVDPPPPIKYDNLKISQNMVHWGSAYKEGETAADNVSSRFMKEVMGLEFEIKWEDASGDGTKWATAMASGDLPELMNELPGRYYTDLMDADMLMDVREIFEKTASPLYKKLVGYPDYPSWQFLKKGEGYYGIAGSWGPGFNVYDVMWVRQDWLDKVGMPFPKTLDDVALVAKAFLDAGLAQIGISGGTNLTQWGAFSAYFAALGRVPFQWKKDTNGSLYYTSTDPSIKKGLELLAKWYKDGLLEADFVKRAGVDSMAALNENCVSGKAGITGCPSWGARYLQAMKQSQPEVQWAWGEPPTGPTGKKGSATFTNAGQINCFLKGTDPLKVEAVINQVNFILDIADKSRTGGAYQALLNFEGYDYIVESDGNVKTGGFPTLYIGGGGLNATFQPEGLLGLQAERKLALLESDPSGATMNPLEKLNCLDAYGMAALEIPAQVYSSKEEPANGERGEFYWPTPSSINETMAILGPKEQEVFLNIITNKASVDDWDVWVTDWFAQGGNQVTEEYNQLYQQYTQG